jgi:hypothetical protein
LIRSRRLMASGVVVTVVVCFLVVAFSSLSALRLSGAQVLERDLGRYEAMAGFGAAQVPAGDAVLGSLAADVDGLGMAESFTSMTIHGLRLGERSVPAVEGDWTQNPFPDRYLLDEGRWPEAPNEVVVASGGAAASIVQVGDQLPMLSDRVSLRVVGVADDRFGADRSVLLLGFGSWATWPRDSTQASAALVAQPDVYSNGTQEIAVLRMLQDRLAPYRGTSSMAEFKTTLEQSVATAPVLANLQGRSWIESNPAGYSIPVVVLPVLAVLLSFSLVRGLLASRTRTLVDLGLPTRPSRLGPFGAFVIAIGMALAAGLGLGVGLSWLEQ